LPGKCNKGSEYSKYLPELEEYWMVKHEDGVYKVCNYTEAECKGESLCQTLEELVNGTDFEGLTCTGGKCTGGYTHFPACDEVDDSSLMNMVVMALICIAIML